MDIKFGIFGQQFLFYTSVKTIKVSNWGHNSHEQNGELN